MAFRNPSAGELNRRIRIRRRTDLPFGDADLEGVFSEERSRWAKIEPVGTAVYSEGVQTDKRITHRITFRFLANLDDSFEVVRGEQIYRIKRLTELNGELRFTLLEVEEL